MLLGRIRVLVAGIDRGRERGRRERHRGVRLADRKETHKQLSIKTMSAHEREATTTHRLFGTSAVTSQIEAPRAATATRPI